QDRQMAAASGCGQLISHDEIKFDVVRLEGKRFEDLKTKRDANLDRRRSAMREEAVEKTKPASHSGAIAGECDSGDKNKINRTKYRYVMLTARGWQNGNDFAAAPVQIRDQRCNLRLVFKRFEHNHHAGLLPNRQLQHVVAD